MKTRRMRWWKFRLRAGEPIEVQAFSLGAAREQALRKMGRDVIVRVEMLGQLESHIAAERAGK